jgi:outer membrane protein assembly factor BamA
MKFKVIISFCCFLFLSGLGYAQKSNYTPNEEMKIMPNHEKRFWYENIDKIFRKEGEKLSYSFSPVISKDDIKGLELGILSILVFSSQKRNLNGQQQKPTVITPSFLYSKKGYISSAVKFDATSNRWSFNGETSYNDYVARYYEVGNSTPKKNNYELFDTKRTLLFSKIYYQLNSAISTGIYTEYSKIVNSKHKDTPLTASLSKHPKIRTFAIGSLLKIDKRNHFNYPSKGYMIKLNVNSYFPNKGSKYQKYKFDFRKFHKINSKGIIAWNTILESSIGKTPYHNLSTISGANKLRGLDNPNQYLNKHAVLAQIEYRHNLCTDLSGVLFTGLGNTNNKINNHLLQHIKGVAGFGLRYSIMPEQKLNLRLDYGIGFKNTRSFFITVSEAF